MEHERSVPARNNAAEISARLSFIGLDERGSKCIRDLGPLLGRYLPEVLDTFYDKVRAVPEVSKFFANDEHVARAKAAQLRHWNMISTGGLDANYAANVQRIGRAHAKVGLDPRWYIGGYVLLLEHLIAKVVEDSRPNSLIGFGKPAAFQAMTDKIVALVKVVMLDMDIAISTYIDAAERARLEAEAQQQRTRAQAEARQRESEAEQKRLEAAIAAERTRVLDVITSGLSELAHKNLSHRITSMLPAQFERLRADYNDACGQLDQVLQIIMQRVANIAAATEQILSASEDLSERTQKTSASLEEAAAALEETSTSVNHTAGATGNIQALVTHASEQAADGGIIVRQAADAMVRIEESSKQIGQIIGVIDEIAFQTNLLALNAGVEAARAGEHGKGFAVVASEVRALAQRSAESAKEIKSLIATAQGNVADGVKLVTGTGQSLDAIVTAITKIGSVISEMSASAQEQARALAEVSTVVTTMDRDTQGNAAMAEELSSATHVLASETGELRQLIAAFRTSEGREDGKVVAIEPHRRAAR